MADTDDPQHKPENSANRPRRRRPWQNRAARGQKNPSPSASQTPSSAPPEQRANGWKPLPPATGAAKSRAAADANRPQQDGGQTRPPGENSRNRPWQDGNSGQNRGERNRNRPPRQPAQASGGQQPARSSGRPRRAAETGGGQDGAQPQSSNRPRKPAEAGGGQDGAQPQNSNRPRRPAEAGSPQDGARQQNSNRPRRAGNAPRQQNGQNQPASTVPPAGQTGRGQQRRRTDATRPRSTGGNGPRQRRASFPDRSEENFHAPSVPIKARGGIRARTENGEFGKNWWAKRWLLAMERLMDGARLQRGRRYARMGQVLSMNEENGGIAAKVQGSRPQPYKVTIRVSPLSDEQWDQVLDVLADQAIFTAQLLAGEMPADIEEAFSTAGVSLFPARGGDLMTECSCPDWANPCKHIAATHYILGDRFDEDPFLIFRMRGRDQEAILQGLRQRRAGQEEPAAEEPEPVEVVEPLDENLARFWQMGPGLENYSVNVQPPQVELPLLKRLGQPDFARNLPLERELGPAYEAISQAALLLAFSDISREPPENGSDSA